MENESFSATRGPGSWLLLWIVAILLFLAAPRVAQAAQGVIRQGSIGPDVVIAQHILFQIGLLGEVPDGIFGRSTLEAVLRFQGQHGLTADGIVGNETWQKLHQTLRAQTTRIHVVQPNESIWALARLYGIPQDLLVQVNGIADPSLIRAGKELIIPGVVQAGAPGSAEVGVELLHWDEAKKIYTSFKVATVTDVLTGKSFQVRRYYGTYHADTEPLTAADTATLREVYGGWSWQRRPIIVEVDGRRIAASMNGMPHGQGSIEENGFPGHFCIHFLGSRIHLSGKMDPDHHTSILRAAGYQVKSLWLTRRNP